MRSSSEQEDDGNHESVILALPSTHTPTETALTDSTGEKIQTLQTLL